MTNYGTYVDAKRKCYVRKRPGQAVGRDPPPPEVYQAPPNPPAQRYPSPPSPVSPLSDHEYYLPVRSRAHTQSRHDAPAASATPYMSGALHPSQRNAAAAAADKGTKGGPHSIASRSGYPGYYEPRKEPDPIPYKKSDPSHHTSHHHSSHHHEPSHSHHTSHHHPSHHHEPSHSHHTSHHQSSRPRRSSLKHSERIEQTARPRAGTDATMHSRVRFVGSDNDDREGGRTHREHRDMKTQASKRSEREVRTEWVAQANGDGAKKTLGGAKTRDTKKYADEGDRKRSGRDLKTQVSKRSEREARTEWTAKASGDGGRETRR